MDLNGFRLYKLYTWVQNFPCIEELRGREEVLVAYHFISTKKKLKGRAKGMIRILHLVSLSLSRIVDLSLFTIGAHSFLTSTFVGTHLKKNVTRMPSEVPKSLNSV